jgi:hypothetical protein
VDRREQMRRGADYVDRILKGAKPAGLPMQGPTRFTLVINRKVADTLGPAISPQLYIFANEVPEWATSVRFRDEDCSSLPAQINIVSHAAMHSRWPQWVLRWHHDRCTPDS